MAKETQIIENSIKFCGQRFLKIVIMSVLTSEYDPINDVIGKKRRKSYSLQRKQQAITFIFDKLLPNSNHR
jgi:hypothetical protein